MRTIPIYTRFILLLFASVHLHAQTPVAGKWNVNDLKIENLGESVTITCNLDLSDLRIASQEMLILTPELRSSDKKESHSFAPVVVVGKMRAKALERSIGFNHYIFEVAPQQYIIRENRKRQSTRLTLTLPYASWLRDATFLLVENVSGCATCDLGNAEYQLANQVLPPLFVPEYQLSYVMPEAEPVKTRSETHAARLNYVVGKYDLLKDFRDNARILAEVDRIIGEIRSDSDLTITALTVTGYASPEGNMYSNMELSKNRAYSFVNYLIRNHGFTESQIRTDWKGEDWQGLRAATEASYLPEKEAVVRIIDTYVDITRRKQALQTLNNGYTYRMLLQDFYPQLRRNEYTIAYICRPFQIEEAKELIRTKPQHLSLNEIYLVANTYPKGSEAFKETFDIAARLYPDDPVAQMNAATQDIEAGAYDRAISRLRGIDLPEAWNNLGIAFVKKGDYTNALTCLKKAVEKNEPIARINLEQLESFLKSRVGK
ncbi:DUF3868 domain-containing protein [Parabacteroides sp. OttesenSCG-928-G06]|nr:DUF3868 domain-containing protein [Parabacteroides sp. OttesenSCG-928-K15]MDL2281732.1 DUF3868 domain-containing protein [Parabacteroides sp. OttesenSCG-928-G06]